jgi:hypothetical protein
MSIRFRERSTGSAATKSRQIAIRHGQTGIGGTMRQTACAVLVILTVLSATSPSYAASNGSVIIHVSFAATLNRVRPNPKAGIIDHVSLTLVLSGTNTVDEKWDERAGRAEHQSGSVRVLGGDTGGRWQVVNAKKLIKRLQRPQNWSIYTVTVTGNKSCRATVNYVLKPGYREFTFRLWSTGQIAYYNNIRATNITCTIEAVQ